MLTNQSSNSSSTQSQTALLNSLVEGKDYSSSQVIVKTNLHALAASTNYFQKLKDDGSMSILGKTQTNGYELWEFEDMNVGEIMDFLKDMPGIESVEPNYIVSKAQVPNDPSFTQLWGLNNTGQTGGTPDADIDAAEAWDITTGSNVLVGVIDTGVDYNHPDLINNIWTNPGEIAGDGIDNDGNGFIDDIHGWDFAFNDADPFDGDGHGTHVAGTIAAQGNNGIGVSGVSWSAEILPIKFLDDTGFGSIFNAIQAVEYATMMGVDLTNNSWSGGGFNQGLYDAIEAAGQAGQLFIAAAGNNGQNTDFSPRYPASYNLDNIISVAATDHNDQLAGFSNYGSTSVDLAAPGVSVYSTSPGGGYRFLSGTSMAAPHVAGVASLLLSQDPTLSAQEVKDRILATADPITNLQGKTVTGGRLNAYNALTGSIPILLTKIEDDFDPDIDNSQWSNISNGNANTNFIGSDGNSLWFNGGTSRFATTNLVNVANGGDITFDLIFGDSFNGGENADGGEDVVLEYSINNGSTWNQIGLYDTEAFTTWTTITETIPTAAQTNNTNFRWRQIANSGNGFDNWALDNVDIGPLVLDTIVDDFDPNIDNTQWSNISNGTANTNFIGSDGNSLWFTGGSFNDNSRFATTNLVDVANGGAVTFDLIFGDSFNGGENADGGEDVVLEYSINNGSTWNQFGLYDTEAFTTWTTITENIPIAAQTSNTSFRWRQISHSGSNFDNWAIDNVSIPKFGEIQGSKWNDLNGDGVRDAGEVGLAGWTIYLDNNQNGQLDAGEISTITDANGNYSFTNLNPGTYTVAEVLKPGWKQTFPDLNGSFETGDFLSWQTIGDASIETSSFGSGPTEGIYQSLLTSGNSSVSDTQLENFLGLAFGSLDSLGNGDATVGSAIKQTVTVSAGSELSFDWNFLTNENTPTIFNDFGFVSITSETSETLANTNSSFLFSPTIFNEETGFATFSHTFATDGTFTIGVGVVDVEDTVVDSGFLVDNFSFTGDVVVDPVSQIVSINSNETVTNIDFGNQKLTPTTIFGTPEDDVLNITDSPVIVFALKGDDLVDGSQSAGANQFFGGRGDDTLIGNNYDQMFGQGGDDILDVANGLGNNFLDGGNNDDILLGKVNDQLLGGQGDDILDVANGLGNNFLDGGKGDDILLGKINDQLIGGKGDDVLDVSNGDGNNTLDGGQGDDILDASNGGGNNLLNGGQGDDILDVSNSAGNNILDGGIGDDILFASVNDQLFGNLGDDILDASNGGGNNILDGGKGEDILLGGFNDQLDGGEGDDLLSGGLGGNTMTGGQGEDRFWVADGSLPITAHTITDFDVSDELIGIFNLGINFSDLNITQIGNDTLINAANTDIAVLTGVLAADLSASNFVVT